MGHRRSTRQGQTGNHCQDAQRDEQQELTDPRGQPGTECQQRLRAEGVEFIQEPIDRYGTVDAGFRDPSGYGWKMIQARP
jgi:hypothetical protein